MKNILKKENIIVAIIMVVIVLFSVIFIGVEPIKDWLKEPITWDKPEYIDIALTNIETYDDGVGIEYLITNTSGIEFSEYDFITTVNGVKIPIQSFNTGGDLNTSKEKTVILTTDSFPLMSEIPINEETYQDFLNTPLYELKSDFEFNTIHLKGRDENGDNFEFKNNGTVKIILIVAISAVLGYLGIDKVKQPWLRIILKVCGLPAILLIFAIMLFFAFVAGNKGSGESSDSVNDAKVRNAQARYKEAANQKKGAVALGNKSGAAAAQAEMDKAMADMIAGSSNSTAMRQAQSRYKNAANCKKGAVSRGNKENAAHAQAEMDKALADMLKNK